MKAKELQKKAMSDLTKLLTEQEADLRQKRFSLLEGQLKDTSQIRKTRRDIARIKTVLRVKQISQ